MTKIAGQTEGRSHVARRRDSTQPRAKNRHSPRYLGPIVNSVLKNLRCSTHYPRRSYQRHSKPWSCCRKKLLRYGNNLCQVRRQGRVNVLFIINYDIVQHQHTRSMKSTHILDTQRSYRHRDYVSSVSGRLSNEGSLKAWSHFVQTKNKIILVSLRFDWSW